jgi:hypothetical protein
LKNTLEDDYRDFIQIQGLKGQIDLPRVAGELGINEEELFDFINQRIGHLEQEEVALQMVGEYLGSIFLFAYWLRGLKAGPSEP